MTLQCCAQRGGNVTALFVLLSYFLFPSHLSSGLPAYAFKHNTCKCRTMESTRDTSPNQFTFLYETRGVRSTKKTRNMVVFWLCSLVLHCFSAVVVGKVTSPDGTLTMPTMDPAYIGNITISPSVKVNYTLQLKTTGPVVLDSRISFFAKLLIRPNGTTPVGEFSYVWLNTADQSTNRTEGRHQVTINKTFSSHHVVPGDFLMTVVVTPKHRPRDIVAFGSTVFRLTKNLNGNLRVKQELAYQRNNNTFAIDQPIGFHVNITDKFDNGDLPEYTFFWYNGSKLIHRTTNPRLEHNFSQPSILHLEAEATAEFDPYPFWFERDQLKFGSFKERLVFKESLTDCNVTRTDTNAEDQSLKLGNSVILNITCAGSSPSAICWNVTKLSATVNETCKPPSKFQNGTGHQVTVSIGRVGWHTITLTVFNDISFNTMSQSYYVYDADSVNIPALVFPIVFIVLGLIITVLGGTYIVRLRRRLHVEVADFDFDPSISVRRTTAFSSMVSAVKEFFARFRRKNDNNTRNELLINRSHSLYESL